MIAPVRSQTTDAAQSIPRYPVARVWAIIVVRMLRPTSVARSKIACGDAP